MADLQRVIEVVFQGTDNVSKVAGQVGKGIEGLADVTGRITAPLAGTTDTILAIDTALVALAATITGVAINAAGQFQNETQEINSLLDISAPKFDELRDSILDYARTSSSSLTDINSSIYSAISAGVDYQDSLAFVTEAERLAVAGRAGLEETTVALISTLNAYGATTQEAAEYSDVFFAIVREGQTTLPELSASLSQVTGIASSAGVPFETLGAAIAELTSRGLRTPQAITAIKAALSNIIKPSRDAQEAARELGVEFGEQALRTQGLDGLLRQLAIATGGNVTEMGRFFGSVEALNGVLALSDENGKSFNQTLESIRNSTGATAQAYSELGTTFSNVNQNLRNNIEVTLVEAGDRLLAQYGKIAVSLGQVFASVGEGIDEGSFDPVFDVLNAFGSEVEQTLDDIARNLPAALEQINWDGFTDALTDLGGAVADLFTDVDLSTPDGLRKAIQSVVDTGESLIRTTEGIVNGLSPFISAATELLGSFNQLEPQIKVAAGAISGFGKGVDVLLPLLGALGTALAGFSGAKLASTFGALSTSSQTAATGFTSMLGALGQLTGAFGAGYAAGVVLRELIDAMIPGVDTLGTKIFELANTTSEADEAFERQAEALAKDNVELVNFRNSLSELQQMMRGVSAEERNLIDSEQELADLNAQIAGELEARGIELVGYGSSATKAAQATEDVARETDTLTTQQGALVRVIRDASGAITGYEHVTRSKTAAQAADTAELQRATRETDAYRLKMEELASNERIKNIEAKVALETAGLEADTRRVEAAFESINTSIESTGKLLGTLFGELTEADSWWERSAIEEQIERENELREQSFDLQKRLTDQQIAYMREKTRALSRGDALIKISADGLEPELEAFMWQIIEKVQVTASDAGAEFLLGIP